MRGRRLAAVGAALALCALVPACGSSSKSGTSSPTTTKTSDTAIDPTREIRIIQSGPPPASWDPANTTSQIQQLTKVYNAVYDTLIGINVKNDLEPRLATAWKYDSTNTVLTLTLRSDVTFTDGAKFDADAAKLNLERTKAGTSSIARLLAPITSIEVKSPTELVLHQAAPNAKMLSALASAAAVMASPQVLKTNPGSLAQHPVGSGPFKFDNATATTVTFVRNDNYWDKKTVFPSRMTVAGAVDPNARVNALLTGQVDVAYMSQDPPTADLLARIKAGQYKAVNVSAVPATMGVNTKVPPLDNEKVRQAINLALDRDEINQVQFNGACKPASQLFVPGQDGYIDGLAYKHDLDKAKQLMTEAGVGPVTIKYQSIAGANTAPTDLYAAQLKKIGITLEITPAPIQEVFPNFFAGKFGLSALQLFVSMPDPAYVTDYLTGASNPGNHPADLVDMVNKAVAMSPTDSGRDKAFKAINQYAFDHSLVIPLCYQNRLIVGTPDVVGLDQVPMIATGHADTSRLGMKKK